MTKSEAIEKAIARHVAHGSNECFARKDFAEEILSVLGWMNVEGIAHALRHCNFATASTAQRMAVALKGA